MRKVIAIIVGILFICFCFYLDNKQDNEINKVALEDLNLHLVGVVDNVDYVSNGYYHGCGIIRVRIISSNIKEYTPPPDQKFYFCIIKNGKAEIYSGAFGIIYGDTLTINTKRKLMSVERNGKKEDEGSISVDEDDGYYAYISKHHEKF